MREAQCFHRGRFWWKNKDSERFSYDFLPFWSIRKLEKVLPSTSLFESTVCGPQLKTHFKDGKKHLLMRVIDTFEDHFLRNGWKSAHITRTKMFLALRNGEKVRICLWRKRKMISTYRNSWIFSVKGRKWRPKIAMKTFVWHLQRFCLWVAIFPFFDSRKALFVSISGLLSPTSPDVSKCLSFALFM